MLYANKDGQKISPAPGLRATCPGCGGEVIAKCGSIKVWHWSHVADECDSWSEPETEWHKSWKERFPKHCQEVVMGPHRADVVTENGTVIEFQHSPISAEEIEEREEFYGENMIWVIDASAFIDHLIILEETDYAYVFNFDWKWPRASWWASKREKYFCFGSKSKRVKGEYIDDSVNLLRVCWLNDLESSNAWASRNLYNIGIKGAVGYHERFIFLGEHGALLEHRIGEMLLADYNCNIYTTSMTSIGFFPSYSLKKV